MKLQKCLALRLALTTLGLFAANYAAFADSQDVRYAAIRHR